MDEDFDNASSSVKELTDAIRDLINANKEAAESARTKAEADKKSAKDAAAANKIDNDYKTTKEKLKNAGEKVVTEFIKISEAGIKLASTLGTQATQGIQLEIKNRISAIRSLASLDANTIASRERIEAAQQSVSQAFVNVSEGFQFSADGARKFSEDLNKGFKTEFQPTAESIRALAQMGITTTAQMDAFRRATGRASLTGNQLAGLYSKNTLSFLLYGNSFAKAASQAEKLGVNLASIQAAQESLVTNLDGTIDTVAQINQLGGQIDFGSLVRIAEQDGPDALMAYVRATVPANLMQSASTRALFKQLGISVEDYMKSGGKQVSAADELEAKMTEQAKETGKLTNVIGVLTKAYQTGRDTFGGLILAVGGAILALNKFSLSAIAAGNTAVGGMAAMASRVLTGGSGLAIGMGGAMMGRSMVEEGNVGTGILTGALSGAAGGAMLGSAILPGVGTAIGAIVGGIGGSLYAFSGKPNTQSAQDLYSPPTVKANDLQSPGYGARTLVTPKGAFALNNADDIVAGTNLFPKGALKMGSDNSDLTRKIDSLISAISNANTTISVGGSTQTVPRIQLVGVHSRNEVR